MFQIVKNLTICDFTTSIDRQLPLNTVYSIWQKPFSFCKTTAHIKHSTIFFWTLLFDDATCYSRKGVNSF